MRAILIESPGTLVATDVLFSNSRPVTGIARFGDALQLVPAPNAAPRPQLAQADHPFIIEFPLKQSIDNGVTNTRRTRGTVEWGWILNLLIRTKIRFINFRTRSMWAIENAPGAAADFGSAKWSREAYGIPGMTSAQAAFSEAGPSRIPVVPHEQYYSAGWHPLDDTFSVPDSLPRLINAVRTLPRVDRRRFMRAAQWFYAALELFDDNTSSSFQALASAIEAMIPPSPVDPCPQCGKDRSPGPTARFNSFLERFAPLPAGDKRPRFFGTRSGLTHGSLLFFLDEVPWAYFSSTESLRQRMRHGEFFHTTRTALVNWLLNRAQA